MPGGCDASTGKGVRKYEGGRRIRENGPLTTDYGPLTTAGGEGCGIGWNAKSVREYECTKVRFKWGMRNIPC